MTEHDERNDADDDPELARLLRRAPRPLPVPAERRAIAFETVRAEWRSATSRSTRRWTPLRTGLAASAAALLVATLLLGRGWDAAGAEVAVAMTVSGAEVSAAGSGLLARWTAPPRGLQQGGALRAAELLTTGSTSAAMLRVGSTLTLRVAPQSQLRFDSADSVTLLRGELYVDSGARGGITAPLLVATAHGIVQHVGTRYLVRAGSSDVTVAVREGRVRLTGAAGRLRAEASAGEQLRIAADAERIERGALAADDAVYAWLSSIPAPIEVEGQTLSTFMAWYSAETGRDIQFTDGAAAAVLSNVQLRGSVAGLTPDQALDAVAAVADLAVSRSPAGIRIEGVRR